MKKSKILIFSIIIIILLIIVSVLSARIRDKKTDENIEQFEKASLILSKQFENDVLTSNANFDFINEYQIPFEGTAVVIDSTMVIKYHPNSELIGMVVPIVTIQEKIKESQSSESGVNNDMLFIYEYSGTEMITYLHKYNNELIFLIVTSEENYR
jgi:hypothetical protein